jgi:hypothetical protein
MSRGKRGLGQILSLALLGFFLVTSSLFVFFIDKKNLSSRPKAAETCREGSWRGECAGTNENCWAGTGVEHIWLCKNGKWEYQYPQCSQRCMVGATPAPTVAGCTPGQVIKVVREDCDTNIGEYVEIEQFYDSDCSIKEKPGRRTGKKCGLTPGANCVVGAVVSYCERQECDVNLGKYVCIMKVWGEGCQIYEKPGSLTETPCGPGASAITGTPQINWPQITPGGGEKPIETGGVSPESSTTQTSTDVTSTNANPDLSIFHKNERFCNMLCRSEFGESCKPQKINGVVYFYCPPEVVEEELRKKGVSPSPQLPPSVFSYDGVSYFESANACRDGCERVCDSIFIPQFKKRYYYCYEDLQKKRKEQFENIKKQVIGSGCWCINGRYQGGGCDGWRLGKACTSKKPGESCNGPTDSSCFCISKDGRYQCGSLDDIASERAQIDNEGRVKVLSDADLASLIGKFIVGQQNLLQNKAAECRRTCEEKGFGVCVLQGDSYKCVRRQSFNTPNFSSQKQCGNEYQLACNLLGGPPTCNNPRLKPFTTGEVIDISGGSNEVGTLVTKYICIPDENYEKAQAVVQIIKEQQITDPQKISSLFFSNFCGGAKGCNQEAIRNFNEAKNQICGNCQGECLYVDNEKKWKCFSPEYNLQVKNNLENLAQSQGRTVGAPGQLYGRCKNFLGVSFWCDDKEMTYCGVKDGQRVCLPKKEYVEAAAVDTAFKSGQLSSFGLTLNQGWSSYTNLSPKQLANPSAACQNGLGSYTFQNGNCYICIADKNTNLKTHKDVVVPVPLNFCTSNIKPDPSELKLGINCRKNGGVCNFNKKENSLGRKLLNEYNDCPVGYQCYTSASQIGTQGMPGIAEDLLNRDAVIAAYDSGYYFQPVNAANSTVAAIPLIGGLAGGIYNAFGGLFADHPLARAEAEARVAREIERWINEHSEELKKQNIDPSTLKKENFFHNLSQAGQGRYFNQQVDQMVKNGEMAKEAGAIIKVMSDLGALAGSYAGEEKRNSFMTYAQATYYYGPTSKETLAAAAVVGFEVANLVADVGTGIISPVSPLTVLGKGVSFVGKELAEAGIRTMGKEALEAAGKKVTAEVAEEAAQKTTQELAQTAVKEGSEQVFRRGSRTIGGQTLYTFGKALDFVGNNVLAGADTAAKKLVQNPVVGGLEKVVSSTIGAPFIIAGGAIGGGVKFIGGVARSGYKAIPEMISGITRVFGRKTSSEVSEQFVQEINQEVLQKILAQETGEFVFEGTSKNIDIYIKNGLIQEIDGKLVFTQQGIDLVRGIRKEFIDAAKKNLILGPNGELFFQQSPRNVDNYLKAGLLELVDGRLKLTDAGGQVLGFQNLSSDSFAAISSQSDLSKEYIKGVLPDYKGGAADIDKVAETSSFDIANVGILNGGRNKAAAALEALQFARYWAPGASDDAIKRLANAYLEIKAAGSNLSEPLIRDIAQKYGIRVDYLTKTVAAAGIQFQSSSSILKTLPLVYRRQIEKLPIDIQNKVLRAITEKNPTLLPGDPNVLPLDSPIRRWTQLYAKGFEPVSEFGFRLAEDGSLISSRRGKSGSPFNVTVSKDGRVNIEIINPEGNEGLRIKGMIGPDKKFQPFFWTQEIGDKEIDFSLIIAKPDGSSYSTRHFSITKEPNGKVFLVDKDGGVKFQVKGSDNFFGRAFDSVNRFFGNPAREIRMPSAKKIAASQPKPNISQAKPKKGFSFLDRLFGRDQKVVEEVSVEGFSNEEIRKLLASGNYKPEELKARVADVFKNKGYDFDPNSSVVERAARIIEEAANFGSKNADQIRKLMEEDDFLKVLKLALGNNSRLELVDGSRIIRTKGNGIFMVDAKGAITKLKGADGFFGGIIDFWERNFGEIAREREGVKPTSVSQAKPKKGFSFLDRLFGRDQKVVEFADKEFEFKENGNVIVRIRRNASSTDLSADLIYISREERFHKITRGGLNLETGDVIYLNGHRNIVYIDKDNVYFIDIDNNWAIKPIREGIEIPAEIISYRDKLMTSGYLAPGAELAGNWERIQGIIEKWKEDKFWISVKIPQGREEMLTFEEILRQIRMCKQAKECSPRGRLHGVFTVYNNRALALFGRGLDQLTDDEIFILAARSLDVKAILKEGLGEFFMPKNGLIHLFLGSLNSISDIQLYLSDIAHVLPVGSFTMLQMEKSGEGRFAGIAYAADQIAFNIDFLKNVSDLEKKWVVLHEVIHAFQEHQGNFFYNVDNMNLPSTYIETFTDTISGMVVVFLEKHGRMPNFNSPEDLKEALSLLFLFERGNSLKAGYPRGRYALENFIFAHLRDRTLTDDDLVTLISAGLKGQTRADHPVIRSIFDRYGGIENVLRGVSDADLY